MTFNEIAKELGELVTEKNAAYGSAFQVSGDVLRLFYPDGVKPEQYKDLLLVARICDKLMRIASRKDAFGESPYKDIAGYAILGISMDTPKGGPLTADYGYTTQETKMRELHRYKVGTNEPPVKGIFNKYI
jgi:hypothetical protein